MCALLSALTSSKKNERARAQTHARRSSEFAGRLIGKTGENTKKAKSSEFLAYTTCVVLPGDVSKAERKKTRAASKKNVKRLFPVKTIEAVGQKK